MQLEYHCPRRNRFAPNFKLIAHSGWLIGRDKTEAIGAGSYVKDHLTEK
jgi:hypothetical protein